MFKNISQPGGEFDIKVKRDIAKQAEELDQYVEETFFPKAETHEKSSLITEEDSESSSEQDSTS